MSLGQDLTVLRFRAPALCWHSSGANDRVRHTQPLEEQALSSPGCQCHLVFPREELEHMIPVTIICFLSSSSQFSFSYFLLLQYRSQYKLSFIKSQTWPSLNISCSPVTAELKTTGKKHLAWPQHPDPTYLIVPSITQIKEETFKNCTITIQDF